MARRNVDFLCAVVIVGLLAGVAGLSTPLLTALFLRARGLGGLLTPALATGAASGSLLVLTTNSAAGTHLHVSAVLLAGAAGVLAVTQRASTWAAIFVWELARPPLWLLLVFLVAALDSHGVRLLVERRRAGANRLTAASL